jgi:heat shock protein HslJ
MPFPSSRVHRRLRWSALLLALLASAACSTPGIQALGNATVAGIYDEPVTLKDGIYEGEPFAPGGASRPRVTLVPELIVHDDIDGDGRKDAWVFLTENAGGSGTSVYLAAMLDTPAGVRNRGTVRIGDRVQVVALRAEGGRATLRYLAHGPGDGACCPTHLTEARFAWRDGTLERLAVEDKGKFRPSALAGEVWRLVAFDTDDPVPEDVAITLEFHEDRISGFSGCNTYSAPLRFRDVRDLSVGPVIATRRACPEPRMRAETRFLRALAKTKWLGFRFGRLLLGYGDGEGREDNVLVFER